MDQKKIGRYIADKRKSLNLTQVQLAEQLGMSDKSVSKWERGVCLPDVSKYQELSKILGISLNELFAGEDLEETIIIQQSERNIIGVAKLGKIKNKRLFNIIVCLLLCVAVLAMGLVWMMSKETPLKGNYITAFAIENPEEASSLHLFGNATLFNYVLDESYTNVDIYIDRYDYGKMTDQTEIHRSLPEGRGEEAAISILPKLEQGQFEFVLSAEWGGITTVCPVKATGEEADFSHSEVSLEMAEKVEKGNKIAAYAYYASGASLPGHSFSYVVKRPKEALKETPLCFIISFAFK